MNLREQQQLYQIKRGEIKAFEQLFFRYYDGLRSYAQSLLKKEEIAEEVVQDVFYNIWKNRRDLVINKNWKSYLYRAAYNNSMMALRRKKHEFPMEQELGSRISAGSTDPLAELQYKETSEWLDHTLESLPDKTREIFLMNREKGLKYREIALELSISEKTVEAHMSRALRALKQSYKSHMH